MLQLLISQTIIFWILDRWSRYTDNMIDDNIILIVKGARENNVELIKKGIDGLLIILKDKEQENV